MFGRERCRLVNFLFFFVSSFYCGGGGGLPLLLYLLFAYYVCMGTDVTFCEKSGVNKGLLHIFFILLKKARDIFIN